MKLKTGVALMNSILYLFIGLLLSFVAGFFHGADRIGIEALVTIGAYELIAEFFKRKFD